MTKFRKNTLLELVGRTDDGDYLVQNAGNSSDRWVIPKATFELTYDEVEDE